MRTNGATTACVLVLTLMGASALAGPKSKTAKKPAEEPAALPTPEARLWIVAPSADGPWTLRIDNAGDRALRIPADIRLLRFEIDDGKAPKKKWQKKKLPVCELPKSLRPSGFPDERALLLAPGQSYIELFDPHLFCFGKSSGDALKGGVVVRSRFGWDPPKKQAKNKPPTGPFAVEDTAYPATVAPLHGLLAPTMVLSFASSTPPPGWALMSDKDDDESKADEKADKKVDEKDDKKAEEAESPPQIEDQNAARLALKSSAYVDANSATSISITVSAENAGHRPMLVAIRPRMLSFQIVGPDGEKRCDADPPTNAVPRDGFRTLKPGATSSMTILLGEVCPRGTFNRPGLYRVTPTLHAKETGENAGIRAYTGEATGGVPTYVRVQTGPEPFYHDAPRAIPTPKPPAEDE